MGVLRCWLSFPLRYFDFAFLRIGVLAVEDSGMPDHAGLLAAGLFFNNIRNLFFVLLFFKVYKFDLNEFMTVKGLVD